MGIVVQGSKSKQDAYLYLDFGHFYKCRFKGKIRISWVEIQSKYFIFWDTGLGSQD